MASDGEIKALGEELGAVLFAWYRSFEQAPPARTHDGKLYEAVGRCFMPYYPGAQEPNRPTGDALSRPWAAIPAGWFVCVPGKVLNWWEVMATRRDGDHQVVTLRAQDGREGTWPRDPAAKVKVRRGTRDTPVSDAVDLFGEGAEILEDEAP